MIGAKEMKAGEVTGLPDKLRSFVLSGTTDHEYHMLKYRHLERRDTFAWMG